MKRLFLVIGCLLVAACLAAFYLVYIHDDSPAGYKKVKGFHYVEPVTNSCQALIPECGVCPGKIIDKQCYVKKY